MGGGREEGGSRSKRVLVLAALRLGRQKLLVHFGSPACSLLLFLLYSRRSSASPGGKPMATVP